MCSNGAAQCVARSDAQVPCGGAEGATMLVDKVATWKRRRDAALRCRPGCQVFRAVQQAAFMVVHQLQTAAGHVRLFRTGCMRREELVLGTNYEDFRQGFAVAATPEGAMEHAAQGRARAEAAAVVKCIANGTGYVSGGVMFVPCMRPVSVMDFVSRGGSSGCAGER